MSKAVVFTAYGDPEVLHTVEVERPRPGAGQILVAVRAAGVQPFDALFRSGVNRQWMPAAFPQGLGNEFAGVVAETGDGVTALSPGDEVIGWAARACYAEHVVVGTDQVVAKPAGMPWPEAGVLSASGQTAATALADLGVGKGDTVLIHAAAGGVGSFAVQLAVALGATAIGTASERNHDYLRSLGAVPVAYGDGLEERVEALAPGGVDAALDCAGTAEALRCSVALVGDRDRAGSIAFNPIAQQLGVRSLGTERTAARLAELTRLYTQGMLKIAIQREFRLEEAAEAHRAIETGHVRGKIVLIIGG